MNNFEIIKLNAPGDSELEKITTDLDALFFEASNTQVFASENEKNQFRETWLGRYLSHYPDHFFLALSESGRLIGYLAGSPDNPARSELFSDVEYFSLFEELCQLYPAQLHVNVAPQSRGMGVGRALIEAYSNHCKTLGISGCHVITRKDADNVGYYEACGFEKSGIARWEAGQRTLIFLGKPTG